MVNSVYLYVEFERLDIAKFGNLRSINTYNHKSYL